MSEDLGLCELITMVEEDGYEADGPAYQLYFDVNEPESVIDSLEEKGYLGTGYTWEAMVISVLRMRSIDNDDMDFDPESDLFAAYSESKQSLVTVANIINELVQDDSLMSKALANAEDADKLDD